MPDDQKISGPSFELMDAGVRIGTDAIAFGPRSSPIWLRRDHHRYDGARTSPHPSASNASRRCFAVCPSAVGRGEPKRRSQDGRGQISSRGSWRQGARGNVSPSCDTRKSSQPAEATNLTFSEAKAEFTSCDDQSTALTQFRSLQKPRSEAINHAESDFAAAHSFRGSAKASLTMPMVAP